MLAKKSGLNERLIFTGIRHDVPEIMNTFNIFAISSLWEGLPRVIPQAMAQGLPVIATNVDGNREAVINDENGIIVPPADPESGTLLVNSKIPALLLIDGERKGEGKRIEVTLSPGIHRLRVQAEGYHSAEQAIALEQGESRMLTASLAPSVAGASGTSQ